MDTDALLIERTRPREAAEADAALMDGHIVVGTKTYDTNTAAEADAALMDGHRIRL